MKKIYLIPALAGLLMLLSASTCTKKENVASGQEESSESVVLTTESPDPDAPTVYFTSNITPEGLVSIYRALGVKATGSVAVKISTGESSNSNHLRPGLIKDLVQTVNGTLVECNTAYGGSRPGGAQLLQKGRQGYHLLPAMTRNLYSSAPTACTVHISPNMRKR